MERPVKRLPWPKDKTDFATDPEIWAGPSFVSPTPCSSSPGRIGCGMPRSYWKEMTPLREDIAIWLPAARQRLHPICGPSRVSSMWGPSSMSATALPQYRRPAMDAPRRNAALRGWDFRSHVPGRGHLLGRVCSGAERRSPPGAGFGERARSFVCRLETRCSAESSMRWARRWMTGRRSRPTGEILSSGPPRPLSTAIWSRNLV